MIHIKIDNRQAKATTDELLVAHCVNTVYFEAEFPPDWDGYEKRLVFSVNNQPGIPVLYAGGPTLVPWKVFDINGGGRLYISAVGLADGKRDVTAMMNKPLDIFKNGDLGDDSTLPDYDPSPLEAAVLACAKAARDAEEAARKAWEAANQAGGTPEGPAKPGKDGGYYTPKVTQPSDDTMRIAFEPSDEDMPTVEPTEVELPAGPAGKTPEKGVDYFTKDDKAEIVEDVLAEVDIPEGGGIDVSGAEVGQTIRISAVDENGVPTEWEPVEFPAGGGSGGSEFEFISELALSPDIGIYELGTTDEYKEVQIQISFDKADSNRSGNAFLQLADKLATSVANNPPTGNFCAWYGKVVDKTHFYGGFASGNNISTMTISRTMIIKKEENQNKWVLSFTKYNTQLVGIIKCEFWAVRA